MPINSSKPVSTPAIDATQFTEFRQLLATEQWNDPSEPLTATIILRRCRRADPTDPGSSLIDMTVEQQDAINAENGNVNPITRDIQYTIPDLFAAAQSDPAIGAVVVAKLQAIVEIVRRIENPPPPPPIMPIG